MGKDSADNMAGDTTVKEKDSRALDCLAEREGFEPPIPVKVWPLSRRLVSTTHAPLRARNELVSEAMIADARGGNQRVRPG